MFANFMNFIPLNPVEVRGESDGEIFMFICCDRLHETPHEFSVSFTLS